MSGVRDVGPTDATAAEAVWASYEGYLAAFQARDLDRTAPFFQAPLVRFVEGHAIVSETDEDVRDWVRSSFARLEELGCTRVAVDAHDLQILDPSLAVLRVTGTRHGRDDLPLEDFDVTYNLVRPTASSPWRIGGVALARTTIKRPAVEAAADRLLAAVAVAQPCAPVRDLIGAHDLESAVAVQQLVTAVRVAGGAGVIGCKVGRGRPSDGPLRPGDGLALGDLFSDRVYVGGDTVPAGAVLQPRVTAHIGLVLAEDLDAEALDLALVRRAVAYVTPVLEISGSRIDGWDVEECDVVADNACAGAVVLGPVRVPLPGFEPTDVALRLHHGGAVVTEGDGRRVHPVEALMWAAGRARELGRPLRAGDLVLTGALAEPRPLQAGDVVRANLGGLGAVQFTMSAGNTTGSRVSPSGATPVDRGAHHGS